MSADRPEQKVPPARYGRHPVKPGSREQLLPCQQAGIVTAARPGRAGGHRQRIGPRPYARLLSFTVTLPEAEELACHESMMAELAGWHGEPEGTPPASLEPKPV